MFRINDAVVIVKHQSGKATPGGRWYTGIITEIGDRRYAARYRVEIATDYSVWATFEMLDYDRSARRPRAQTYFQNS